MPYHDKENSLLSRKPTNRKLFKILCLLPEPDKDLDISPISDFILERNHPVIICIENAEAYVVVTVVRVVIVTISYTAVIGIVVPVTTAFHTVRPAYSLYP